MKTLVAKGKLVLGAAKNWRLRPITALRSACLVAVPHALCVLHRALNPLAMIVRGVLLSLALLAGQVWAQEEASPGTGQSQTVIKLPLKLKSSPSAAVDSAKEAAPAKLEATKPAAPVKAAEPTKELEALKETTPANADEPEKMLPSVKLAPPPAAKRLNEPSPEVHAPVHKRHAIKKKRKPHPQAKLAVDDQADRPVSEIAQLRAVMNYIVAANARYRAGHKPEYFAQSAKQQNPRATVVTCSDSQVQTQVFHGDAVNDLYIVRDIGNQLATAEGSVEYGVRYLHTPLLLFVGHTACDAVKLAAEDYSAMAPAIQKELATINIPKGIDPTNGALLNLNNQVEAATLTFSAEVEAGKLAILGALYDIRNDLKQGYGKLIITNLNGETDPAKIREMTQSGQFFKYGFMGK